MFERNVPWCKRLLSTGLLPAAVMAAHALFFAGLAAPAELPAGTKLEVRMSAPTGSRISFVGERVEATVIAPVFVEGRPVIAPGSIVSGTIDHVARLGLGFKQPTAAIRYRFDTLRLRNFAEIPLDSRVVEVETAKERVNEQGLIRGIYPTANVSAGLTPYLYPMFWIEPHLAVPFFSLKVVVARSPDPEIFFPAGTELILRTTEPIHLPDRHDRSTEIATLAASEAAEATRVVNDLALRRSDRNGKQPSDLVNLVLLGKRDAIDRAFHAAGWSGAHRTSLMSIYGVYHAMVQRMGYGMAPFGKLTLNGNFADAEFQKSLNTFSKRHHTRLWRLGKSDLWLSAATEDIGYKVRKMHLTHATDPAIDNERNKVLNDIAFTGCVDAASFMTRDLGSDAASIRTDGRVAVLRINDCKNPRAVATRADMARGNRPKSIQALAALRNDLIRINPAFLVYNTSKALWCSKKSASGNISSELTAKRSHREPAHGASLQWNRPSVLDESTQLAERATAQSAPNAQTSARRQEAQEQSN